MSRQARGDSQSPDIGAPKDVVRFNILGPLRVEDPIGEITLPGVKERTLLCLLLARPNQVVTVDQLVDGLWGDSPPPTAEKSLQAHVVRLRDALEPQRPRGTPGSLIFTVEPGYVLRCDDDALDALRFEHLAAEGHRALVAGASATAMRMLGQALELWRGRPFGEFTADLLEGERTRLNEIERTAREDLAQARLDLGKHRELIPDLEQQVAGDPLGERAWAQLMLALYRAGRQAEALSAFHRAREVLADELGIEPGDELQRLQHQILEQDPSLLDGVGRANQRGLPPELSRQDGPFVGRESELANLAARWEAANDPTKSGINAVYVHGPVGIGRTRLLAEFVGRVGSDAALLYASGEPTTSRPLAVFERLAAVAGHSNGDDSTPEDAGRVVGRQIARLTREDVFILALDDVDLSNSAVLAAWRGMSAELAESRGLVLLTGRDDPPPGIGTTVDLALGPLDITETMTIVAGYVGEDAAALASADIAPAARGIPALVHEQAADWASRQARSGIRVAARRIAVERETLGQMRDDLRARIVGLQAVATIRSARETVGAAPYKGLSPFEIDDSSIFFGREQLCGRLVARMAEAPLLVLVGPSGSGKSSLARAGLISALADGVLPGSDTWQLRSIEIARLDCAEMIAALGDALGVGPSHRVVLVDQLEQLFTHCDHKAHRRAFLDLLAAAAADRSRQVSIVLTLRSDYFGHLADSPAFALAAAEASEVIGPMTAEEIQRAIELPAQRAGAHLEPGLAAAIAADAHGRPGALPLLSTALLELWEGRSDATLTWSSYRRSGGLAGAVARLAEDAFGRLSDDEQVVARRILLRTVGAGDDRREVGRRVPLAELAGEGVAGQRVLSTLAERRLMSVDTSAAEVTHEALYQQWPRLRGWLDEDAEGRDVQRRLIAAARDWQERGREDSDLYRGARLVGASDWAETHDPELNEVEHEFLAASRAAQVREADLERNRTRTVVRANRRLRFAIVGLVALLVVSLAAGGFALAESQAAGREARAAIAARLGASALVVDNLDRELLLAAAAYRADSSLDTRGALLAALTRSPSTIGVIRGRPNERLVDVAVSADGRYVAMGANAGTIAVWDRQSRQRVALVEAAAPVFTMAFSSDSQSVYAAQGRFDGWHIRRWSIASGAESPEIFVAGHPTDVGSLDNVVFAKNAPIAAVFVAEGRVSTVDLESGDIQMITTRATDEFPGTLAISADGQRIAVATQDAVSLIDSAGTELGSFDLESSGVALPVTKMAFTADSHRLAIGADDGAVHLIDPVEGTELESTSIHTQSVKDVTFTPDGESVLSVSDDGVVARWYPEFDHVERFTRGHTGRVFAVAVSGDGQTAFSAAADNTALEWDLSGQRRFGELVARMPRGAMWWAISNDGNKVALAYEDGSVSLTDLATGTEWQSNSGIGLPFVIAFSPDGNRVAVAGQQGSIAQLDTSTGRAIGEPIDGFGRPIFFIVYSPDGQTLAVADEGSTWLVDGASGSTRTKIIDGEAGSYLAWSNDGSRLAVGLGSGDLLVWDVVGNSEVARVDLEEDNVGVTSVAWSGDGNQIATGSASGATRLWSTGTWEPIGRELRAHGNYVIDMRFSSDGKWLATFGGDGAAAIWDVEMGRQLGVPLVGSQNEWGGVWLSPDGERLKTYQGDGTVWEWPLNDNGWLERVCAVAGRDLTHDEWATYAPGLEASPVCQDRQGQ